MISKEKIKKLCKENNIDLDIVEDFIKETGAYPFLMRKPSSYLLDFMERYKGIKFSEAVIKRFIFDPEDTEILEIASRREKEVKCDFCGNPVLDYLIFQTEVAGKIVCFHCFSKKSLSYYLEIPESIIEAYLSQLSDIKSYQQIIKIFLITIYIYYKEFGDWYKKEKDAIIDELRKKIESEDTDLSEFFSQFKILAEYYKRIFYINIIREVYLSRFTILNVYYHTDFFEKIKKNKESTLIDSFKILEGYIHSSGEFFGNRIEPWLVEDKTGKTRYGYVLEVIRKTEKAILCRFSLLDGNRIYEDWSPKSALEKTPKYFYKLIQKATLEKMGFIL